MKYKVRRQGVDLGFLSLEEVRRRRGIGEFTGNEYVQADGSSDWQPLELVLRQGYQATPPQIPKQVARTGLHPWIIAGAVLLGVIMFGAFIFIGIREGVKIGQQTYAGSSRYGQHVGQPAIPQAKIPIVWTTNTLTKADVTRRARAFSTRLWLAGYEQRGQHNPECAAAVTNFLQTWIARKYGDRTATNGISLADESENLAADTNCTDPLVLTVIGDHCRNASLATNCYARALAAYAGSRHLAYPQFYADVKLRAYLNKSSAEAGALDQSALQQFSKCFTDGSFTPEDQPEIATMLTGSWGYNFFHMGQTPEVCRQVHNAGSDYRWLALILDGEQKLAAAQAVDAQNRGANAANANWDDYYADLDAAGKAFTAAWNLKPQWPLAAERMIYVSLCNSGIDEMRVWFDRTTTLQIEDDAAWQDFRWGLGSEWYGNQASLLAFGVAAVDTGRFDTDVPRKYIDCINDVEAELKLPAGHHIYGRADIWPDLQKMYNGYIHSPAQEKYRNGWRTSYAIVAYFASQYATARTQLEALDWKLSSNRLDNWGTDISDVPLEIAARTGSLGAKVSAAEELFRQGDHLGARAAYVKLADEKADTRTEQFIKARLIRLTVINP